MRAYLSQVFSFMRGRSDHPVYRKEVAGWSYIRFWRNIRSGCVPGMLVMLVASVLGCGLITFIVFASDTSAGGSPDWPLAMLVSLTAAVVGLFYVGEIVLMLAGLMATVL